MTDHSMPPLALAALAGATGAAGVLLGVLAEPRLAALAVLVAAAMLVTVPVPWGGDVPVGVAVVTATVALLPPAQAAASLAVAVALGGVLAAARLSRREAISTTRRSIAGFAAALAATALAARVANGELPVLTAVVYAGIGMLAADVALARWAPGSVHRMELRAMLPVHLTLTCAGALVAVAVSEVGVVMATVAAFPILITRFSFQRYAGATDTLQQTVQALGLVPELAGLAPLGHSERSATYATAISRSLGLDRSTTNRVVTATRLHHLGAVPSEAVDTRDVEVEPGAVAASGARILRRAGFPGDVADLLEAARADTLDAVAPSLEAAVVRVAATFDDLVGDDPASADRGLALVSASARDPHSRRAAAALLELAATDVDLVADALAAGDRFREAAVGLDLDTLTAGRAGGELLPFARRA